ncbi:Glutaminase [Frankliniella fusca]|uniref:Glutaminase n=1 Tax=Frankliniella fusca TaxID=407009 RepID=A0AAE1HMH9_9NEOP|nr:Glutaminase [Frankliniella fusca]
MDGDRKRKKWLTENLRMPKSTLYYRRKCKKEAASTVSTSATLQTDGHDSNPFALRNVDQQQEACDLGGISSNEPQQGHSSVPGSAFRCDDEELNFESQSESLHDATSSSDESVHPEVVLSVKENPAQRAKPRRKVFARPRPDSDDALSSSSESCDSDVSLLSNSSPPSSPASSSVPQPLPASTPPSVEESDVRENCANQDEFQYSAAQEPLCPCTDVTVQQLLFMTLTLGLRHGLTWVAQVDILKMIATIFPNASIPTTKHMYKEKLNVKDEEDITYHVFCNVCDKYLGKKPEGVKTQYCATCEKSIKVTSSLNCFVSLSVESQLQKFLQDNEFVKHVLNYRFQYPSRPQAYSEIYDGDVYKSFSGEGGILSSPYNFSFTFFTDGVAFGKSSKKTIWPIYLTVNELPYELRSKYFVLAGVYAGSKDPNQLYFLKPLVDALNNLATNGVKWVYNSIDVTSYVITICCVVDSVARETTYVEVGCRYPITNNTPRLRSEESYLEDLAAVQANRSLLDRSSRGVKGTCCAKAFTELILDSSNKKKWIGVSENNVGVQTVVKTIDKRIESIQSSSAVHRELRVLSSHSLWKASYLSKATHILLQRSVTEEQVHEAHHLLMCYTFFHEKYFGARSMVYNIHLLSHIAQCVFNFGPLWGYSSFIYESKNRYLLQLCKNPNSIALEISRKFLTFQSLPGLSLILNCSEKVIDFSDKILNYKKVTKCHRSDNESCVLLGLPECKEMPENVKENLNSSSNFYYLYEKMIYRNFRFTTSVYSGNLQNNDSCIFLTSGECVVIKYIIEIPDLQKVLLKVQSVICVSSPFMRHDSFKFDCVRRVVRFGEEKFIPLEEVNEPCLFMNFSGQAKCIARIPYGASIE